MWPAAHTRPQTACQPGTDPKPPVHSSGAALSSHLRDKRVRREAHLAPQQLDMLAAFAQAHRGQQRHCLFAGQLPPMPPSQRRKHRRGLAPLRQNMEYLTWGGGGREGGVGVHRAGACRQLTAIAEGLATTVHMSHLSRRMAGQVVRIVIHQLEEALNAC